MEKTNQNPERISNIEELLNDHLDNYEGIKDGSIPLGRAKEINNSVGKTIGILTTAIKDNIRMNNKKEIKFIQLGNI